MSMCTYAGIYSSKLESPLPGADPGGGYGGQKTPPSGIILGKPK